VLHDQFLATTTSSGTVWRAFGSEEDAQTRYRHLGGVDRKKRVAYFNKEWWLGDVFCFGEVGFGRG